MTNIGHGVDKRWRHFKSISTIFKKICNFSLVHIIKVCKKQNLSPNVFASSLSILSPLVHWIKVLFWFNQYASVLKLSWFMDFGQNLTKFFWRSGISWRIPYESLMMIHMLVWRIYFGSQKKISPALSDFQNNDKNRGEEINDKYRCDFNNKLLGLWAQN